VYAIVEPIIIAPHAIYGIIRIHPMSITPEMEEVLQYLQKKDSYALFAGFAAFLLTGVEPSPDIDVFVVSEKDVNQITDDFLKKGWRKMRYITDDIFLSTVEKNNTTFDIIFSKTAKIFLQDRIQIHFKSIRVFVISPEALFLTKMNQVASPERSDEKTKRDREVIHILRKTIDVKALKKLLQNVDYSFWTKGYF
jgi:hypothetical protein